MVISKTGSDWSGFFLHLQEAGRDRVSKVILQKKKKSGLRHEDGGETEICYLDKCSDIKKKFSRNYTCGKI